MENIETNNLISYTITPNPLTHEWNIHLAFTQGSNSATEISLPNWVPGSYLIRDFSRHITQIRSFCNGKPCKLTQISKNKWQTEARNGLWEIHYTVYGFDLSVRGSFLSNERGFFDGASILLQVVEHSSLPHRIHFEKLPEQWQIATTLPHIGSSIFQASSYAELIDHPVEMGKIELLEFEAAGIPHRIALSGHYSDFDRSRFVADIRRICETELAMFSQAAPFSEYLFMLHLGDNIYGGLEHISSTALLADRNWLPPYGMGEASADYRQLLGLFSHEYFHAWNVKSIKPKIFHPYNLDEEAYTEQLWAFEGITSYYDDLFLAKSGVISAEAYLELLAQGITRVQQTQGRLRQTLAESSFTAWNKFYKQDENSPNAIVSYYQKGALAALCLDLLIRQGSKQQWTLADIMQQLYRDWLTTGQGIAEQQWQQRCQEICGIDLNNFFQTALYSTDELPLAQCLASVGVQLTWCAFPRSHGGAYQEHVPENIPTANDFGAKFRSGNDHIVLTHVFNGGSAENAGLCPQDKIIALNGYAISDFNQQWSRLAIGETAHIHFFRSGILHETDISVQAVEAHIAILSIQNREYLEQWLFDQ